MGFSKTFMASLNDLSRKYFLLLLLFSSSSFDITNRSKVPAIDAKANSQSTSFSSRGESPTKRATSNRRSSPQQDLAPKSSLRNETMGSIGDFSDSILETERINESITQKLNERAPFSSGESSKKQST